MNPAVHYPMLAAQAAAHACQTAASSSDEANRGRQALLDNIKAGIDGLMPLALPIGAMPTRAYKVSTFLGECDRESQALLFAACHAAMSGRSAEEVKARLEAFVHVVAREYGEDSSDAWEAS